MKKRILGLMLIVCMLVAQFTFVNAAPSKSGDFDVITDGSDIEILDDDDYLKNVPEGKKPISPVFELNGNGGRVEFYVPGLTENVKGPVSAYVTYSDGTTVVLEAVEVDYVNKTVTFNFDADKLPATIVLYGEIFEVIAFGEAPKTGVMSTWAMWFALAGVFAVAALASRKSRA